MRALARNTLELPKHSRACLALLASVLLVSASSGCAIFTSKGDYADYRAIRLASDEQAQLLAMQRYVARHPGGHWRASVQATREQRDVASFEAHKATRAGLQDYLRAFPDGVFAAQARSRLSAIALIDQRKQQEAAHAQQLAAERKQREAELARTWVSRFVGYWSRTLSALSAWGQAIPEVAQQNPAFSRAFGAEPRPRCTRDECVKYYTSSYGVPVPGGTRVERSLSLLLRLRMKDGKLERAELLLPERGFSRWFEIEQRRAVVDGDPEARTAAVQWAQAALMALVNALGSDVAPGPADYVLPPIDRPAIGPTGELTDVTAEDPSAPRNRLSNPQPGQGPDATPDVAELVKPDERPAADMVFAPLQVDKNGHASSPAALAPSAAPTSAAAAEATQPSGEVMVMAPLAVPKDGESTASPGAPGAAPPAVAPPPAAAEPVAAAPGLTRVFQWHALRLVVFAAAGDAASPAYDGLVIERLPPPVAPTAAVRALRSARH